jgi:hypothetical protein
LSPELHPAIAQVVQQFVIWNIRFAAGYEPSGCYRGTPSAKPFLNRYDGLLSLIPVDLFAEHISFADLRAYSLQVVKQIVVGYFRLCVFELERHDLACTASS